MTSSQFSRASDAATISYNARITNFLSYNCLLLTAFLICLTVSGCTSKDDSNSVSSEKSETATEINKTARAGESENNKTNESPEQSAEERDAEVTQKTNTQPIEMEGEVIDTWCYVSGVMGPGRGPEHEKCGRLCVGGGVTAGILDDKGNVYIAAKHQGYKGCAGLLLPYVAKRVRVKGWLAERGGVKLLKIRTVEEVNAEHSSPETKESP